MPYYVVLLDSITPFTVHRNGDEAVEATFPIYGEYETEAEARRNAVSEWRTVVYQDRRDEY